MRKTSVDIPAFIAEGSGKVNDSEFSRAIQAAVATASRLEYYALMAVDLEFLSTETHQSYEREVIEVKKMLNGFNERLT